MNRILINNPPSNVRYGLSDRKDGSMLVAHESKLLPMGESNRAKYFEKNKIKHWAICRLAHGTEIKTITQNHDHSVIYDVDGLVTSASNLFLCLTVADCLPVYFWSKNEDIVALAHAGWRGIAANIIKAMVTKVRAEFVCDPKNLMVAIGPGIRKCHFEVRKDVADRLREFRMCLEVRKDKIYFDLVGAVKHQLLSMGVQETNIADCHECTYCLPKKYFSHRRDHIIPIDVMLAYIALAPS